MVSHPERENKTPVGHLSRPTCNRSGQPPFTSVTNWLKTGVAISKHFSVTALSTCRERGLAVPRHVGMLEYGLLLTIPYQLRNGARLKQLAYRFCKVMAYRGMKGKPIS